MPYDDAMATLPDTAEVMEGDGDGMNRADLHRLVDALPDQVLDEVGRRLAEEYGRLVAVALGQPGEPRPGEGDLDEEFERHPGLRDQVERALGELKRGDLGTPHEVVRRRYRGD